MFDFDIKYQKGEINAPADALSQLHTAGEIFPHDDSVYIAVFELDIGGVVLGPNRSPNEVDFLDTEFATVNKLFAVRDDPAPTNFSAEPIGIEELLQSQLDDPFCAEICRKRNNGEGVHTKSKRSLQMSTLWLQGCSNCCSTLLEGPNPSHRSLFPTDRPPG